jgi:hypothetical protein
MKARDHVNLLWTPIDPGEPHNYRYYFREVEPLASHIRDMCKKLYTLRSHITIDEAMLAYRGSTSHTVKLPKKPIKEGYKVWALGEHGYIWDWLW